MFDSLHGSGVTPPGIARFIPRWHELVVARKEKMCCTVRIMSSSSAKHKDRYLADV